MSVSRLPDGFDLTRTESSTRPGGSSFVNSDSSLFLNDQHSDGFGAGVLSIALIGPDEERRKAVAAALAACQGNAVREFSSYPASLDDMPKLLDQHDDVLIIDLDSDSEYALKLVESICASNKAMVMVYSTKTDPELLVRCMRAGAREFLTLPFAQSVLEDALGRATARRPATRSPKKTGGRLLAFLGAKGGDGVTTLASNFAVSLAQESDESTLLIDLDLPLGDAALNLGISAEYSTINALQNASRLDSSFLSGLLVKHSSGVSVLAAPGKFPKFDASDEDIDKLIAVARQDFDNVVIDMGSRLDLTGTSLFKEGSTIYLVIQAGIAGLRNSNRLISQYFATGIPKLEIVLNRFQKRSMGVGEDQITKALTRPAQWKIPNDFAAVRRMQHTAVPLALEDSPISQVIRQMARAACGLPELQEKEKKAGFSFKSLGQSIAAKISSAEETPAITQLSLEPRQKDAGVAQSAAHPHVPAGRPRKSVHPHSSGAPSAAKAQASFTAADSADPAVAAAVALQGVSFPSRPGQPETRTYKGATYVRGADGKWNLQRSLTSEVKKETPVVTWPTPASVPYGTALGAAQLNAQASVAGDFVYTPAAGVVLASGVQTLSVAFTPADSTNYAEARAAVPLIVTRAMPVITWPTPASVAYGTALGAAQLNAKASVAGNFVYTPAAGVVLASGVQTLSVAFTPADSTNYAEARATVSLIVTRAMPVIAWPAPASIAYGTALRADQLNATASISGKFAYTPAAGEVLAAGIQTLSVVFTPADSTDYAETQATVPLAVTKATPVVTWPAPAAISHGTALGRDQLNATALVPGTFAYTPAAGEVLGVGTHTLSATFTPMDAGDYTVVQAFVQLTVTKASPATMWPPPQPAATLNDTPFNVKSQRTSAKTSSAHAGKPSAAAKHEARKAPGKIPAKPFVVAAAKTPEKPPIEVPVKTEAKQPVEAPARAMVATLASKSSIDVGPGLDLMGSAVFEDGTTIYLVMQPGSAGLHDSNRVVSQFFTNGGPKPEIMINRLDPRSQKGAGGQTSTALARRAYSPISRLIGQVVRPVSELTEKRRSFSLKKIGRGLWTKFFTPEVAPSITHLGLTAGSDDADAAFGASQPRGVARISGKFATPLDQQREPETRTYKGVLYARGADGQWHLLKSPDTVKMEMPVVAPPAPVSGAKPARKASAKAPAKRPARTAKKSPSKDAAKRSVKAAQNSSENPAKSPAKRPVQAAAKTSARKAAPARKKSASAPSHKAEKPVQDAVEKPISELVAKPPTPDPAVNQPFFEPMQEV